MLPRRVVPYMNRRIHMLAEVLPGSPPAENTPMVTVVGLKTVTATTTSGTSETSFEEEVNVRAETVTVVLTKILEQPAAVRHWGINE